MGIAGTGTVHQNRLHRVPIIDKKEVEKKVVPRGFSQTVFRNDQVKTCTITYTICLYIPICLYFLIYLFFYNMYLPTYLPGYLPYFLPTFLWFHRSWLHGKITRPSTWRATSMGQPTGWPARDSAGKRGLPSRYNIFEKINLTCSVYTSGIWLFAYNNFLTGSHPWDGYRVQLQHGRRGLAG